jgi:hypothetical protein
VISEEQGYRMSKEEKALATKNRINEITSALVPVSHRN